MTPLSHETRRCRNSRYLNLETDPFLRCPHLRKGSVPKLSFALRRRNSGCIANTPSPIKQPCKTTTRAPTTRCAPIIKDGLHDAWQTWEELGYRDEIDLARQTIDSITRKGLLSRRENAKHTPLTSKLNDPMYGDYLQTSVFPSNALEQQSWTKVSFDASNLSQNTTSSAHTVGATAGRSWLFGLIKVAGNAGATNATSTMTAMDDKSTIAFELAQIPLIRP